MTGELESRVRVAVERSRSSAGAGDPRAFFQRRTTTFTLLLVSLWVVTFLYDRMETHAFQRVWITDQGVLHACGCALALAMWLVARRPTTSLGALRAVDVGGTALLVGLLCAMLAPRAPGNRPEIIVVLGSTLLLVVRSAIVPSTFRASAWLGGIVFVMVVATSTFIQRAPIKTDPLLPTAAMAATGAMLWSAIAVAGSLVITRVTSSLRAEVQGALALGQYTLVEKIGEGAMGEVFRARHALLRRPTAVKVLTKERATEALARRFERESQRMADLSHPNIVSIYDFGQTADGVFFYAMELVDGLDLQRVVDEHGPQPPSRVHYLLLQATEALVEAHDAGLVHRDIKLSNLMIAESGWCHDLLKLADFGLVKERDLGDAAEGETTLVGTPTTMAPEVIRAARNASPRSDLYALGAVAYELLCGAPVFAGGTSLEICARHLHMDVVPPSVRASSPIPPSLESLVLRCLAKDPSERPASAAELAEALRECRDVPAWRAEDAKDFWAHRKSA